MWTSIVIIYNFFFSEKKKEEIPYIEITSDHKEYIKNEFKKLIEVCGVDNLNFKESWRPNY